MSDTVAALSSGLMPSGVAVIRISGPKTRFAVERIAGSVPAPRHAGLRTLRDPSTCQVLDKGLVLFFPGPNSFTGEDVAEFHCHGGRAVVDGVLQALWSLDGVRPAEAGDFTRQAFANGKLDLTQVEAVGDLIHATTSLQREQALDQLQGAARDRLMAWKDGLADARAMIEADLDFSDEDDVPGSVVDSLPERLSALLHEMAVEVDNPIAERLRQGFRVVLAGAPNSGKSTLLNALLERDAALVSPIAGTTRDQIDVPIDLNGLPVVLSDTAGLRDAGRSTDPIETMGIERSRHALAAADCIVWLEGGDGEDLSPLEDWREKTIRIRSKADVESGSDVSPSDVELRVSGQTGEGLPALRRVVEERLRRRYAIGQAEGLVGGVIALDARRRSSVQRACDHVTMAIARIGEGSGALDHAAEELRLAQRALAVITGDVDADGILDRVFSKFCIGK